MVSGAGRSHDGLSGLERCPDHPARYRKGCMDCAMTVPGVPDSSQRSARSVASILDGLIKNV
ncbi:hypothetical protein [Streptomyces collinus]|uniref:hypothetical protein n=1 Tax=Streptomyces collinus TaxID=42684 RepID=UPI0036B44BE4